MAELNLPDGYSFKKVEFTYVYNKEGKLVLALPTENCTPKMIKKTIKQIKKQIKKAESTESS